ncbi:MAG TPA: LysE family translocator [Kiloniellales bacterium]|nr:LysE family translocator [Kiloniellales bacterium]
MSLELWIAFALASAVLVAIPGPTVLLVVGYALGRGRSTAWATVPGVALGDVTAMTVSLLGAGAVLAASAQLFTLLKLAGAAYLVWLGIQYWRTGSELESLNAAAGAKGETSGRRMFWSAYVVTALNPKGLVFFIAFMPQFVDATAPLLPQFAILEATFVTLAALNVALYATLAGELRTRILRPSTFRLVRRLGGTFLIGAGLLTAAARRGG